MLKYLHQLTVLTVILLFISAFTMCPAMAEHVTSTSSSVPSIDTSQAIRDLSIDENDIFYVFTIDGQQGIVHERKIGEYEGGLSRVEDVIIGDQCAALVSDTPEQTIVAITGGYLLTFDKNQKLITLSDSQSQGSNENEEEALVIAANEQIDEALVSVTQSQSDSDGDSWLSTIASLVPFSAQTIVKAGTLVCLTCVNPMLGAGYFVSTCLIGSANAIVFVVIPAVAVELGEVALKITAGVVIGAVVLETLKKMCKRDDDNEKGGCYEGSILLPTWLDIEKKGAEISHMIPLLSQRDNRSPEKLILYIAPHDFVRISADQREVYKLIDDNGNEIPLEDLLGGKKQSASP